MDYKTRILTHLGPPLPRSPAGKYSHLVGPSFSKPVALDDQELLQIFSSVVGCIFQDAATLPLVARARLGLGS